MQTKNKPASESQEYVILHEDDYRSEELTKELGHEVWIHKATGKIYYPDNKFSRNAAQIALEHDDPLLRFLRGEIEL